MKGKKGNWIAGAIKKPGALRAALHVKKGEKIPEAKLEKAEKSKSPVMRKRANLAETLGKMRKKQERQMPLIKAPKAKTKPVIKAKRQTIAVLLKLHGKSKSTHKKKK